MSVKLNTKHLSGFINEEEYAAIYPQVEAAHKMLEGKTGPGNDFLGWMYLPRDYDKEEFARIKEAAAKIRQDSDVLVVAGIGGSYLGARAVVEAVRRITPEMRPRILACAFANDTIEKNGEPHVVVDIRSVKNDKVKALQAHASQTGWMMQETAKRVDDGEVMSDSWLNVERFYNVTFND